MVNINKLLNCPNNHHFRIKVLISTFSIGLVLVCPKVKKRMMIYRASLHCRTCLYISTHIELPLFFFCLVEIIKLPLNPLTTHDD